MIFEKTHKNENSFSVRTTKFGEALVVVCQEKNDRWSEKLHSRILTATWDMHGPDIVYHRTYYWNFTYGKNFPLEHTENPTDTLERNRDGRANMNKKQAFWKVTRFFEVNDDEKLTVRDFVNTVSKFLMPRKSLCIVKFKIRSSSRIDLVTE